MVKVEQVVNSSYSNILSPLPSCAVFYYLFGIQLNRLLCYIVRWEGIDAHSHIVDRDIPGANNTPLQSSQEIYHNKRGQKNLDISGLLCYSPLLCPNHLRQADRNDCYNFCWCCIYIPYWLGCKTSVQAGPLMCSFNLHTETLRVYYLVYLQCLSPLLKKREKMAPSGWKQKNVCCVENKRKILKISAGTFYTPGHLLQFLLWHEKVRHGQKVGTELLLHCDLSIIVHPHSNTRSFTCFQCMIQQGAQQWDNYVNPLACINSCLLRSQQATSRFKSTHPLTHDIW